MARAHPKISENDADKIKNDQSLLNEADRNLVLTVQKDIEKIHSDVIGIIKAKKDLINKKNNIYQIQDDQRGLLSNYEDLLFDLEDNENFEDFKERIQNKKAEGDLPDIDLSECDTKEHLKAHLEALIEEKNLKIIALEDQNTEIDNQIADKDNEIDTYTQKIEAIKNEKHLNIDVDEEFNLLKIDRMKQGKQGPTFSVVFANFEGKTKPFILYRGKEYQGKIRELGKGGFGRVKLAQDFYSHELVAIKTQSINNLSPEVLQEEKEMLRTVGQFKGALQRNEKDYIIQTLHYGENLKNAIEQGKMTDVEILKMLEATASEIQKLHDMNLIHRDIKLENFIWDNTYSKCKIIDLAFIKPVEGDDAVYYHDQAGTDDCLSPEAKEGNYSKRSDIYAFGVLMSEVLENNPALFEKYKKNIESLKHDDFDLRASSLNDIIKQLQADFLALEAPPKNIPTRRPLPVLPTQKNKKAPPDIGKKEENPYQVKWEELSAEIHKINTTPSADGYITSNAHDKLKKCLHRWEGKLKTPEDYRTALEEIKKIATPYKHNTSVKEPLKRVMNDINSYKIEPIAQPRFGRKS